MMIATYATVSTAARALLDRNIGLLIACDADGRAVGVVSRLDLIRHLADDRAHETLAPLMTTEIVTCRPDDDLYGAWQAMATRKLQSLPVLDAEQHAVGVLDLGDALRALFEQEQYQEQLLEHYVSRSGYN
jgi:CBS domain-containing protein